MVEGEQICKTNEIQKLLIIDNFSYIINWTLDIKNNRKKKRKWETLKIKNRKKINSFDPVEKKNG